MCALFARAQCELGLCAFEAAVRTEVQKDTFFLIKSSIITIVVRHHTYLVETNDAASVALKIASERRKAEKIGTSVATV